MHSRINRSFVVCLATLAIMRPPTLEASTYETETKDDITVRCDTVSTQFLPQASLQKYDIEARDDEGLLSCVVQQRKSNGKLVNIPANIQATRQNFYGVIKDIEMREIATSGEQFDVSYIGTYNTGAGKVMTFTVRVEPAGDAHSPFTLTLEDRQPLR